MNITKSFFLRGCLSKVNFRNMLNERESLLKCVVPFLNKELISLHFHITSFGNANDNGDTVKKRSRFKKYLDVPPLNKPGVIYFVYNFEFLWLRFYYFI